MTSWQKVQIAIVWQKKCKIDMEELVGVLGESEDGRLLLYGNAHGGMVRGYIAEVLFVLDGQRVQLVDLYPEILYMGRIYPGQDGFEYFICFSMNQDYHMIGSSSLWFGVYFDSNGELDVRCLY